MLRKLHKIYCQSSKYKADKERKVHSIRYPHITDYTQQTMWRKIFVCVVFIIPMMYIQEATSQRNCEMTRCGPNKTCNATPVPNCQCRPQYGRNFSGHCIRKCDLIHCNNGTVCNLAEAGKPICQSKCDLIQCDQGTVCILKPTGNPMCQSPCELNPCGKNATCHYDGDVVICPCKPGFTKNSTVSCVAQCEITPCGPNMTCNVTAVGGPTCQCRPGFRNSSGDCIHVCENNRCGENAICTYNSSTVEHHVCTCKQGFNDTVVESVRMCLGQDQNMAGVIAAGVVSGIIVIVVICLIIYAVVRYRSRFKRPSDNPLESNVRMTDSVTEHYFRGSSSSLDITINTQVIVETRSESNAKQGNGGSPGQIKVQEASSDYDMETLYGNGNIPENKRLALENKSLHPDNLYSNSSIAENKRRDLEDKTARQVVELSPLDDEDKCEDGDQPRYNTLTETGFANGVAGSKNFSLSASTDCTAEEKNDCEYNHLRLKVL